MSQAQPACSLPKPPDANPERGWSNPEIALIFFLYLLPIIITFHGLITLPGLALAYLVLNAWIYQKMLFKACTRCENYGKKCPILGGKAVTLFWSRQEGKLEDKDRRLLKTLWIIMAAVPIAALALTHRYYHLAGAVTAIVLFHLARTRIGCRKCRKREECTLSRIGSGLLTGQLPDSELNKEDNC